MKDKLLGVGKEKIILYNISIESISSTGLLTLKLEKNLRYGGEKFIKFLIKTRAIAIKYFQNYGNREHKVQMIGWNISEIFNEKIQIQLKFSNNLKVSFSVSILFRISIICLFDLVIV